MGTLFIAIGAAVAFIVAYHTYGRWLGQRVFRLSAQTICPSCRLNDGVDYVPTSKAVVFGHHFTSIAGTGPIVGPAIAIMWGWLPALLWVILGSIFIGAVHDFGALVVSLRNNGQTVGEVAGRVLNRRVRLLFLFVLFMSLTIVLAIFGLVIAAVFKQYPAAIFPCMVQIPIAVAIGLWLHRKGVGLLIPSLLALAVMYLTVIYGDQGWLHSINTTMAGWSIMTWVGHSSGLFVCSQRVARMDATAATRLHQFTTTDYRLRPHYGGIGVCRVYGGCTACGGCGASAVGDRCTHVAVQPDRRAGDLPVFIYHNRMRSDQRISLPGL